MPPSPAAPARPWPAATTATRNSPRSPPGPSSGRWGWATPSATPGSSPARRCWMSARAGASTPSWPPDGSDPRAAPSGWTSWRRCASAAGGHAAQAGVEGWTEFRQGEMEDIPLPDESVDVAISNGVLNLSARKSRALAEIFRVLAARRSDLHGRSDRGGRAPPGGGERSERLGWVSVGGDGGACLRRQTATGRVRRRLGRRAPAVRDRPGRPVSAVHPRGHPGHAGHHPTPTTRTTWPPG